jgi:16S rRNA (uracil1498-N3)-methyltransferase
MKRFVLDSVEGHRAYLSDDELHHLVRVFRSREGDLFDAIDCMGRLHHCVLRKESGKWFGEVLSVESGAGEKPLEVALAQALIKKDKFEWVIQKAVELGVSRIMPIATERTEIRLKGERESNKVRRWRRIVAEAVKQCRRNSFPELSEPLSLEDLLALEISSHLIVLDEEGGQSLREFLGARRDLRSCVVLVGPEGGWGNHDRHLFMTHGAVSVSLGPRILRAETASVVAMSILQYEIGDLGRFD